MPSCVFFETRERGPLAATPFFVPLAVFFLASPDFAVMLRRPSAPFHGEPQPPADPKIPAEEPRAFLKTKGGHPTPPPSFRVLMILTLSLDQAFFLSTFVGFRQTGSTMFPANNFLSDARWRCIDFLGNFGSGIFILAFS